MKTMTLATSAAFLLMVAGPALAVEDESAYTIDLSSASSEVNTYHVKCQFGREIKAGCGLVSLWENTNGVRGLQTTAGVIVEKADTRLTP